MDIYNVFTNWYIYVRLLMVSHKEGYLWYFLRKDIYDIIYVRTFIVFIK